MKLFVGNLNYQTTENQLQKLFSEFGEVKAVNIITDKYTNRARGFAFVEMNDSASGQKAVDKLNNTSFDQQTIVVNEARPREENSRRDNYSNQSFGKRY
jgi:RNA recognition motif-containing protein